MPGTGSLTNAGICEFATSLYGSAADPMDTVMMRDGVMHGLHHMADSMAQVRVNFMAPTGEVAESHITHHDTETPATANDWVSLGGSPFGPWPLTLRADGSAYKLRILICGAVNGGGGATTATFRVVIAPNRRVNQAQIEASVNWVFEAATTSTTSARLTGQAQGTGASATLLTIPARVAQEWTRSVSVYDGVSDGTPHTVEQCLVAAHVFGKTSNVSHVPLLTGLHLQEFVG